MNFFGSQPQPTLPINPGASPPWLFPLTQQQFLLSAFHRLQLFFFSGFGVIETSLFFFFFCFDSFWKDLSQRCKEIPVISPSLMEPENVLGSGFQPAPGATSHSMYHHAPSRDVCLTPAALIHLPTSPKITQKTPLCAADPLG